MGKRPRSTGDRAGGEGKGSGSREQGTRLPEAESEARPVGMRSSSAPLIALGAVIAAILFFAAIRIRLADTPLERDEGEYAYAGELILHGVPPYQQAYNMKFPGTYYSYAAIMSVFGKTPAGIHYGLVLVNALTALLVFGIGRRLLGDPAGAAAAIIFLLLTVDRWVMGTAAHATHFVLLPALGGLYLLLLALDAPRAWKLVAAGALLGIAVLMKQHAVLFLPLALLMILLHPRERGGLSPGDSGSWESKPDNA